MNTSSAKRRTLRRYASAILLALATLTTHAADLTVSAAASLTNAFRDLGPLFEAQNPGTKVLFNFAASDALLQQIAKGAPVDVFASADQETMDKAEAQKLLAAGSRHNFVRNSLVMISPSDSALSFKSLDDLKQAAVKRVALGNPTGVPAGRYAKSALEAEGLWSAIEPKAIYAQSVRQALDYVARGEVEVGFVYATDAMVQKDKVKIAFSIPTETPITYPIAVVADGPNPYAARKFIDFVATSPAQAVLAKYGFQKP
ncbi:MAG TPA: molybdate ABC transporter substrate-binding protein [Burkholderiales bacterium]|nr:molybdate ABC transporter substrate-binding protein [Burkholderiales bacterium]